MRTGILMLLTACALTPPNSCFCGERVARCLVEAQARMLAESDAFEAMARQDTLDFDKRQGRHLRRYRLPTDLLTRFDGHWRGAWNGMKVDHRWRSLDAATQLVLINDGGVRKHGINYIHSSGTICGIVMDREGARLHEGHYRPSLDAIEWATPERTYREHVHREGGTRVYSIQEFLGDEPGARADYHELPQS